MIGYPNSAQDDEPLKSAASDALRSEDTLMMQATDEHSIHKLLAGEGKRVTACYADYTTHPTDTTEEATPCD